LVFAHHFHPRLTDPALELYRDLFQASDLLAAPRTIAQAFELAPAPTG